MDVVPDAGGYDLKKGSNTSRVEKPNEVAVNRPVNQNSLYYDMSKNKYLYIFNHFKFSRTTAFGNEKPSDRNGTRFDVKLLDTTFKSLGFEVKVYQDLTRHKIKEAIEKIIGDNDHSKTSCVALAILTHGSYDGYLFAEDEPYEIKDITKLLEHQRLVMIPKLLFLQISLVMATLRPPLPWLRYRMSTWQSTVDWFTQAIMQMISMVMDVMPPRPIIFRRMSSWRSSFRRFTRSINSQIFKFYAQMRNRGTTTDSDAPAIKNDISKEVAALEKDNCKGVAAIEIACHNEVGAVDDCCNGACRGHALDKGHQVEVDGLPSNFVHVPSHIDFLILHSAADGHASFRCTEAGSWMIQSLCKIIQEHHTQLDINQLITLVNHRVAFDHTAFNKNYPSYNNKKQTLETRYTLTKFLKL